METFTTRFYDLKPANESIMKNSNRHRGVNIRREEIPNSGKRNSNK